MSGAGLAGLAMVVATFNLHYIAPDQGAMSWDRRREAVVAVLREARADIVGFQEMETFAGGHFNPQNLQRDWVASHFPQYAVAASGDPEEFPGTQPIFYRASRFEALEQGWFFFSPTPERLYARPWAGRYPAFCSWARLRERSSGLEFYVYNVHFDHGSLRNRLESAQLVARRIAAREHPRQPVIVLGDFNAPAAFRPVRILLRAGLQAAPRRGATFHHYRGLHLLPAIDHVLYSSGFEHGQTRVLRGRYGGVWPSDHYPVAVSLRAALRSGGAARAAGSA